MTSKREKAELGTKTLELFCSQFGKDVQGQIILEILFEGLMNAENLFISGEQEQKRSETNHGSSGELDSDVEIE